jgi:multimeric flavodoxin WrbA
VENRVLVAFYSRKGHTKELGEAVCRGLEETSVEVDCLEVVPEKEINVISASASSLTHAHEPIRECQVDLDIVNLLVLGTPVWGGFPAPYMRSFLECVQDLKGLPVVLFTTCAYGDRSASSELRELVRETGGRPMEYHVWTIRRDGPSGKERTAEAVVDSAMGLLPTPGSDDSLD